MTVKIKKSLLVALEDILRTNLSHDDHEKEVRISPRRWEQVLLYASASLPVDNPSEAQALIDNLKINFRNYLSGESAEIGHAVVGRITDVMDEIYNTSADASAPVKDSKWLNNLKHQIKIKQKAGKHRAYVPVVSGPPGIAKTTMMKKLAKELNMYYVGIDCAPLDEDDVVGLPVPGDKNELRFAKPKLFHIIERKVKRQESSGTRKNGYLIFFDELNRVKNEKVFNALRRVILDKSLGHGLDLPENSVVTAAINPDDLGTLELTSHMRDVMDIIPSGPSLPDLLKYIKEKVIPAIDVSSDHAVPIVMAVFNMLVKKFRGPPSGDKDSAFYLDIGTELYMSPREYQTLIVTSIDYVDTTIKRVMKRGKMDGAEQRIKSALFEGFKDGLTNVFLKHGVDDPNFFNEMETWIHHNKEIGTVVADVTTYKSEKIKPFSEIFPKYLKDHSKHLYQDQDFINYLNAADATQLGRDFGEWIKIEFQDFNKVKQMIMQDKNPAKRLNLEKEAIEEMDESITDLEYMIREVAHALKYYNKIPGGLDALLESAIGASKDFIKFDIENMEIYEKYIELKEKLHDYINSL